MHQKMHTHLRAAAVLDHVALVLRGTAGLDPVKCKLVISKLVRQ
jgi:hypothetical protein